MSQGIDWYEDRMHEAEELDELYKLYQENELFESMKRLGIIRGGNKNGCIDKPVSVGSDVTSIENDNG